MPAENGEKRRETSAHSCEEDRGDDSLEWSLREYERTLSSTTKGNEVATDEVEIEEHTVNAEREGNRHPNGELKNLSGDGGKPKQNGDAEREKGVIIEEHTQTAEQHHQRNSPRSNEHSETSPTEPSHIGHDKESDSSAKQDTKHQEDGDASLRFGEDPQAFFEGNRELLVEQGLIPEKGEVRLDDKTTLKLDVNEGLAIIHENQHYKITTVEQERIGDLELHRYKTDQGEEFLRIPRENMTIPPYETPWYALPPTTYIHLDKEYRHELLEAAIEEAGGIKALRLELEERGTQNSNSFVRDHLHDRVDGIGVNKLIPILTYLSRDLNEPNSHITAVGCQRAVEKPSLPFRLDSIDGARLHAARFSDGTLYICRGGPIFEYANKDAEQRNRIVESLTNVFGKPNISNREQDKGEAVKVRTSTEIIGYALQRSGAITGEVVRQNPDIPTFILQGSKEMKREWLRQAFGDEGSTWPQRGLVKLTRATDATHTLSDEQRNRLDALSKEWERIPFVDLSRKPIKYCRFDDLPGDIQEALKLERPRLLESEAGMLHHDFGINVNQYPIEINERKGGYGVSWVLQTASREDSRLFYTKIGFPQNRKQKVLGGVLKMEGDDSH